MDWSLIITIIGTAIATIGVIYGFLRNLKFDLNSHIDRLETHVREENAKMDQRVMETNKRMDGIYHLLLKKLEKI